MGWWWVKKLRGFNVLILHCSPLLQPPGMWSLPLMWATEMRTLQCTQMILNSMTTSGTWYGQRSMSNRSGFVWTIGPGCCGLCPCRPTSGWSMTSPSMLVSRGWLYIAHAFSHPRLLAWFPVPHSFGPTPLSFGVNHEPTSSLALAFVLWGSLSLG